LNFLRLSCLARPVDLRYRTNQIILALSLLVGAGWGAWNWAAGDDLRVAALFGAQAGLAVFLSWAISRELDPDHDRSAFLAAGLALVVIPLLTSLRWLPLLWVLVMLRVVNRTSGRMPTWIDTLVLLGLGLAVAHIEHWSAAILCALAFTLDSVLPRPTDRHVYAALLMLILPFVLSTFGGGLGDLGGLSGFSLAGVVAAVAGLIPVVWAARTIHAVDDSYQRPLVSVRVRAGIVLSLAAGLIFLFAGGAPAWLMLAPLWAAIFGVEIYRLFSVLLAGLVRWRRSG
jgi:hypothetical protein